MQIGNGVLGLARRSRLSERSSLLHTLALLDEERAEMRQGRLVSVGARDRDCEAVRRNLPRECHLSGGRRANTLRSLDSDVDATMLTTGIRVVADREPAQDRPVGRPVPSPRRGRRGQCPDDGGDDERAALGCLFCQHEREG
jgi:hypothetical protein